MEDEIEINDPIKQRSLYCYADLFNEFAKFFDKKKAPHSILLSGQKGCGKATFVYHIINYLLSKNEDNEYNIKKFQISDKNKSFKLVNENIHPNFFLIENIKDNKDIKIDQIRNLHEFLNKTTLKNDVKIILIDGVENLNQYSSNSILKAIEEPRENTYFFLVHDNSFKIIDTIKSRCTQFKFFLKVDQKIEIFKKLSEQYNINDCVKDISEHFYFDSPGSILRYFLKLDHHNINILNDKIDCIMFFINKFYHDKNSDLLNYISSFIQKYYNDLFLQNNKNLNSLIFNNNKILLQIYNIKKFNLNEKNMFLNIEEMLLNEKK